MSINIQIDYLFALHNMVEFKNNKEGKYFDNFCYLSHFIGANNNNNTSIFMIRIIIVV